MLGNAVAITAGKGGVLKTSLACHLAGLAADGGWRALLVDADPQGNAMFDLGYPSDGGAALAAALLGSGGIDVLDDVRPDLDVICGGPALDAVATGLSGDIFDAFRLEQLLSRRAGRYDLIVVDSPARELWLRRMILTAARWVIVPAGVDRASRVGLPDVARTINEVRDTTNPDLDVLAVVAGPIAVTSTRIRARTHRRLGELIGDPQLVANTVIRYAPLVAEQCRELGLLTHEYAALAEAGHHGDCGSVSLNPTAVSSAAAGLAADWAKLVGELLTRYRAAPESSPAAPTS